MLKLITLVTLLTVFQNIHSYGLICLEFTTRLLLLEHKNIDAEKDATTVTPEQLTVTPLHKSYIQSHYENCTIVCHVPGCVFEFNIPYYRNKEGQDDTPIDALKLKGCYYCDTDIVEQLGMYYYKDKDSNACSIMVSPNQTGNYAKIESFHRILI